MEIRNRIERKNLGEPFTPAFISHLGTRANIDQALSRMVKTGELERVARGVYVRPLKNRYTGKTILEPAKVAQAIASEKMHTFSITGAEAARRFGLTTQMPTRPVFLTSGKSRLIQVGGHTIEFRHTTASYMAFAGRPAGDAVLALLYLGQKLVTTQVIAQIKRALGFEEFELLKNALGVFPSWLCESFYKFEMTQIALQSV